MHPGDSLQELNTPISPWSCSDLRFSPNFFTLCLKNSKNDSQGFAIMSLLIYDLISLNSPSFILTKEHFSLSLVQDSSFRPQKLQFISLQYTGYSFRIGAEHGISTASKILGRWSSSIFESCIRPDPNIILSAQQALH